MVLYKPEHYDCSRWRPLTICIVLNCSDGIVVATDSQSEFSRGVDVKRLAADKIKIINERYIIAGAGVQAHTATVMDAMQYTLINREKAKRTTLNDEECKEDLLTTLLILHKKHNIERAAFLGGDDGLTFSPICVFAGRSDSSDIGPVFFSAILHIAGLVEPVGSYGTVGSGAAYAELMLKNLYYDDINIEDGIKIAAYIIGEVISIDTHCGGEINIAILDKDNTRLIDRKEIVRLHDDIQTEILKMWEDVRQK